MGQKRVIAFVLHAASHVVDARQVFKVKNIKTKTLILTQSTLVRAALSQSQDSWP